MDAENFSAAAQLAPDARRYSDWRELLAKEGDRIGAVNFAVPDQTLK